MGGNLIASQVAHNKELTQKCANGTQLDALPLLADECRLLHYLVIPVHHISTVNDLKRRPEDHSLGLRHMLNVGKTLLEQAAPKSTNYRFGFHQPPFNSVNHLHLHCFALPYIPRWKRLKYLRLGPLGFIEPEKLLEKIKP
ncbi:Bifunctional adenosine 5'-phosphosulfate phosphorylase/adenylylsulfatase HINT4-like protein [Drosera capensis]